MLKEKFDLDYVKELLALTKISDKRFRGFVYQAIEECSYGASKFIVDGLKKVENREELEAFWREKNLSAYYEYLKQEKRVAEMFELLEKLPQNRENFFKKNKQATVDRYRRVCFKS